MREQLRAILERSELPQREFASWVLGASDVTLSRYLAGARIPECRRNFIRRLERVLVRGDLVIITLRVGAVRKVPRWLLERRKRGGR